jgi:hypothetical protein
MKMDIKFKFWKTKIDDDYVSQNIYEKYLNIRYNPTTAYLCHVAIEVMNIPVKRNLKKNK